MIVRKAVENDFPTIYYMGYDVWGSEVTKEEHAKKCAASLKYKKGQWFVLEQENKIISSLICYRNSFGLDESTVGVGSVATLPEYRKNGFVSYLLRQVIENQGHGDGVQYFFLYSDIKPEFYQTFGFKILPPQFQKYEKSVAMLLTLQNNFNLIIDCDYQVPIYF